MRILVIGASGGTGREIVKQALEAGHDVTALVRNPAKFSLAHEHLTVARGNVMDARVDRRHRTRPGCRAVRARTQTLAGTVEYSLGGNAEHRPRDGDSTA